LIDFFFSSRRRHTSSKRDWSSDVCSSDLFAWRFFWMFYFSGFCCSLLLKSSVPQYQHKLWATFSRTYIPENGNVGAVFEAALTRSEERRVGKSGDHGSGRDINK